MIEAPHDPAWAVWADQLQAQGDPRGELIALELLAEGPAQSERLAELYQPHVERVGHHGRALLPGGWLVREVERWRFGYVLELSLGQPIPGLEPQSYSALFGADELRCVSSLRVELEQAQVDPLLDALERHRPPLSELLFFISDTRAELDDRACDRLWAALPGLRHLSFPPNTGFAHINHPNLTTVSLLHSWSTPDFELVARSKLPALIRLNNIQQYVDDRIYRTLRQEPVMALFERLEVLDLPGLFFDENPSDPPTPERLDIATAAGLRTSAKIFAIASPEVATTIRKCLPHLDLEFVENYVWKDHSPPFPPKPKNRVTLGWRCGQPSSAFNDPYFLTIVWLLVDSLAGMNTEKRRVAKELIIALDASERGQSVAFDRAALLEMLRPPPDAGGVIINKVIAALEQHRTCCPEVVLTLEAWPEK
jgi:hypothetical protein